MIRNLIATFFTLILFFPGLVLGDSRDALIASIDDRYEANKDIALARGAAAGTGTSVDWEIMHGNHSLLPNRLIAGLMQRNMESLGGLSYTEDEQAFAETIYQSLTQPECSTAALISNMCPCLETAPRPSIIVSNS